MTFFLDTSMTGRSSRTPPRRRAPRTSRQVLIGRLVTEDGDHLCRVQNISASGLMLVCGIELDVDERVRLELRNGVELSGKICRSMPPIAGVEFDSPVDVDRTLSPFFSRWEARSGCLPRAPRFSAATIVLVRTRGTDRPALMQDISQSGAKLRLAGDLSVGDELVIAIPGLEPLRAAVARVEDQDSGIDFAEPVPFETLVDWLEEPGLRY